jgi:hypothetical protein
MLVINAYLLKRAQLFWAISNAFASASGDHGMMPPMSLPFGP